MAKSYNNFDTDFKHGNVFKTLHNNNLTICITYLSNVISILTLSNDIKFLKVLKQHKDMKLVSLKIDWAKLSILRKQSPPITAVSTNT